MSGMSPPRLPRLGARVVLRRRRSAAERRDGGPPLTDVLGVLTAADGASLSVRTRTGVLETVASGDVVAVKEIPVRAVPRRDIRALEAAAALAWPGLETASLGGWLLRAGGGFTGRANATVPLGDPGLPVAAAVEEVQRWYAQRRLPARFQLPLPLAADLERALAAAGWGDPHAGTDVEVLTAEVAALLIAAPLDLPPVEVGAQPDEAWLATYHYRGGRLPEIGARVLRHAPQAELGFASVREGGAVLGVGRGALTTDPTGRSWLGLTAVEVAPAARRRGVARHLLHGVACWAADRGARSAYLQVAGDNVAALALYRAAGFVEHHRYRYRVAPARTPGREG